MILSLSIQGLAIIESLSIDFGEGFNVITGETGAGKSVLIRALNLLLGGKASPDSIRKGSEQATVAGSFSVPKDHDAAQALNNLGIPFEEENGQVWIVVRRLITAKGKSQAWINDVSVTNQALKELGASLVDIFGQHENQRLLNPSKHLLYIDQFLKDKSLKTEVQERYRKCAEKLSEIESTLEGLTQNSRNQDYLRFRFDEIKKFAPSNEDYERVKLLCESTDKQVAFLEKIDRALRCLEGDEDVSVLQSLKESSKTLSQIPEEFAQGLKDRVQGVVAEVEDISYELSKQRERFDVDEGELEAAQSRLFGYQDLFRKLGVKEIETLMAETEKLETDLSTLESGAERIREGLDELRKETSALLKASEKLTEAREKAFAVVKKSVEGELSDLAMTGAKFDSEWREVKRAIPELDFSAVDEALVPLWNESKEMLSQVSESGKDTAEFLLASNRGEATLPLVRIASGGELSRIMLALKKALAADAETCVLVFDEIDTGISGRVADVVGQKMRDLSKGFQVICISHLPQVAVYADTHFLVEKARKGDRTETQIVKLSEEESAEEIARLLSGAKVTAASLENAKHLIKLAHSGKKATRTAKPRSPEASRP